MKRRTALAGSAAGTWAQKRDDRSILQRLQDTQKKAGGAVQPRE